jgi:hypothetical protein
MLKKIYEWIFGIDEYYAVDCSSFLGEFENSSEKNMAEKSYDLGKDTVNSAIFDEKIRNTLIIENVTQAIVEKMAKKIAAKAMAKVILSLTSVYGIATDLGDVLDIMDALIGKNYASVVDQSSLKQIFEQTRAKYEEVVNTEYKECIKKYITEQYQKNPNLSTQQIDNLATTYANKLLSMTSVSTTLPPHLLPGNCFRAATAKYIDSNNTVQPLKNNSGVDVSYVDIGTLNTCSVLYNGFYEQYLRNNLTSEEYGEFLLYRQKLNEQQV